MAALGSHEAQMRAHARARDLDQPDPTPAGDLKAYLRGEYQRGTPLRLTRRQPTATGQALSDRLVSRLEIANALRRLPYRQRRVVEMCLIEDVGQDEVSLRLSISARTVREDQRQALEQMAAWIYEWG